ncbi:D111/G-patch domain-containing protein [Actinidia rufa]|uniref:D111/G-patch domain-containing protein n=1 Tax=Actinidia rufa TaxID=165716 RepID=A0A7J0GXI5_9ERIC|nr:D111/G-patch domain-containing protein [Actinidia rufa]
MGWRRRQRLREEEMKAVLGLPVLGLPVFRNTMKLSFSIPPKPSSKQPTNPKKPSRNFNSEDQDPFPTTINKEFVTEFDSSKTLASEPNKLVIPPKPNEWRPHKKMKNLELPLHQSDGQDLRFEVESDSVADGGPHMSYGLNLRNSSDSASNTEAKNPESVETVLLRKLKDDLSRLPDDVSLEEYAEMPVEGFGAALLAGYGWYEGRGIGRKPKGDVKVVQYEKRTAKEGLGFFSDMPSNKDNSSRINGSNKKEKEQRSGKEGGGGGFSVGKDVRIIGGRDVGLKGRVLELVGSGDWVVLKILRTDEKVKVRIGDVAELGSVEEERCLRKLKELKIQGSKDEMGSSDGRRTSKQGLRESKGEGIVEKRKDSKRSREIVDVVGPTTCDISMDGSRELIQGVDQELLETALPRRGGAVLVLCGKHKGAYGSLVDRDMENETGVVRDADTHAMLNVRLEQIAEYIGDPSCIGY